MDLVLPFVVLAAAVAFTYAFCIRPMRRGEGRCLLPARTSDRQGGTACADGGLPRDRDRAAEVALLRQEVEMLKTQLGLQAPSGQTSDPHVSGQ